jgi:hypothetical protein
MPRRDESWVTEGAPGVDAADGPGGRAVASAWVRRPVIVSLLEVEPAVGGSLVLPPDPVLLRRGGVGVGGRHENHDNGPVSGCSARASWG